MYEFADGITMLNSDGDQVALTNFTARITEEVQFIDGRDQKTVLTLDGKLADGELLPAVQIPAEKFAALSWIMAEWGARPIIFPVPNGRDHIRAAIQFHSKPKKETVYTHTGWTTIDKKPAFITAAGALFENGLDRKVRVELPTDLSRFEIVPNPKETINAINATLSLTLIGPPALAWTLILAAIRPAVGPVDYAIHISGQTGTFKSELASLVQCHYGPRMDARTLPGSWSSTANALEAQAFRVKNCIFVVDDFVPQGNSWTVKQLQATADRLIRAQGNQQGRARLTDTSTHQETLYPRGMILSTGEDIPTNHSIRARMMILDMTPGDVQPKNLSLAQSQRSLYSIATAAWIQWIAGKGPATINKELRIRAAQIRDQNRDIGHTRTPSTMGDMIATIELYLQFAIEVNAVTKDTSAILLKQAIEAITECCKDQARHLQSADPCETFIDTLRSILASNLGHFRSLDGGIPAAPTTLGWTEKQSNDGISSYTSHGPKLGWVDWVENEAYLDIASAYNTITKAARGAIQQSKTTMLKRLKDQGFLTRTDDARQRLTIRVTCENASKNVLAMKITQILDQNEVPE